MPYGRSSRSDPSPERAAHASPGYAPRSSSRSESPSKPSGPNRNRANREIGDPRGMFFSLGPTGKSVKKIKPVSFLFCFPLSGGRVSAMLGTVSFKARTVCIRRFLSNGGQD